MFNEQGDLIEIKEFDEFGREKSISTLYYNSQNQLVRDETINFFLGYEKYKLTTVVTYDEMASWETIIGTVVLKEDPDKEIIVPFRKCQLEYDQVGNITKRDCVQVDFVGVKPTRSIETRTITYW